ncbi:fimbrial protein [Serratia marcescens]|uniref:fimbrial protein n=1 Tax=Serratia marcescens TaxID=615 RepID=UPI00124A851E|nr:fimbrial protein [Serratia marcescens]KAB1579657.1 fimbrial protein [Serratia marcescens]
MATKKIGQMTFLALLLGSGVVHAGQNANVEITGNLVTHTCDISVPQASYDLGNWSPTDFGTVGIPVGSKQFILTVKNCSGTLAHQGDYLTIQTNETGKTNNADAKNFYGDDAGTNAGITLDMEVFDNGIAGDSSVTPSSPTFAIHQATADGEALSGKQWAVMVTAAMKGVAGKTVSPGALKANLQFTMAE